MCDFNINFQNCFEKSSLSKFLLNVIASNRNSCDLTGNFVYNLLKLIQQYLNNIILLKFKNTEKYFENFIAKFQKNIENF